MGDAHGLGFCDPPSSPSPKLPFLQACVLQRQRKGSMSSNVSASTDSNTYYEDDFSSTEDSSQGGGGGARRGLRWGRGEGLP